MILASELHSSLADPILDSLNFLNEVMDKFPEVISFAPGAPNPKHLYDIEITEYIERYIQYFCEIRGLNLNQARVKLFQYGPARGLINDLVATTLRRDKKMDISPDDLVITVGAQEAMLIVLRALFRSSQDQLAVVNPCFVGILGAARLLDINVVGIDETEQSIDFKQLEHACIIARRDNKPIRALYVAPDYSNPSGSVLALNTRLELLRFAKQYDLFLLEDNAYGFTAPPEKTLPTLKELDEQGRVIFIGTFAKICLPGARVGYVIADQKIKNSDGSFHRLADDLATIKSMVTVNTSPICQALIGGMLLANDGSLANLERERAILYQKNLNLLLAALKQQFFEKNLSEKIYYNQPEGGFFVRVRLPVTVDRELLELSASKYGVLWTPMEFFYLNGGGKNELRLSCSYLTSEQILEGVSRLSTFLDNITTNTNEVYHA